MVIVVRMAVILDPVTKTNPYWKELSNCFELTNSNETVGTRCYCWHNYEYLETPYTNNDNLVT